MADSSHLYLVSSRNFTHEMHNEMAQMDINHHYGKEVVGLGNRIIIPDLGKYGSHGLSVFERAGFRSMIAVPITTYKVLGIMGAAYRRKTESSTEFFQLFTVIANLVGMALNRNEYAIPLNNSLKSSSKLSIKTHDNGNIEEGISVIDEKTTINNTLCTKDRRKGFQKHIDKMSTFRKSHEQYGSGWI